MTRQSGGDKRSSWLTFARRLFLVRRLIRGPASAAKLISEARWSLGDEIWPPEETAALRHDLAALRNEFDCVISRGAGNVYTLNSPGRLALLDLPDAELEAMAFLAAAFAEGAMPNAPQVAALLERLRGLMPEDRRRHLARSSARPRLVRPVVTSRASEEVTAKLKGAVGRQQIEFEYRSPYAPAGETERHRVSPYDLIHRDGQTYLEGYCHECSVPRLVSRYIFYRLDRIVDKSLKVLPAALPPGPMPRTSYGLRYRLSAHVAGQEDIRLWFPDSRVESCEDGSVVVSARITDLWQARQILLGYREHCRVLEPPELIDLMLESIARLAELYSDAR